MPLRTNLVFAGYDSKKPAVLLKGPFGSLYRLQPISGENKCLKNKLEKESSEEDEEEDEYIESECSESYVSSSSIYSINSDDDNSTKINNSSTISTHNIEINKDEKLNSDNTSEELNILTSSFAPIHGTVLNLKELYYESKEFLNFIPLEIDSTNDDIKCYYSLVVLGYDEYNNVLLLPKPKLLMNDGICSYKCLSILQLSLQELNQYYYFQNDSINISSNNNNNNIKSFNLPLSKDFMICPQFEESPLHDVFGVYTDKVYYLSIWSAYVQFVGFAWGIPWVRLLHIKDKIDGSFASWREIDQTLFLKPLTNCFSERSLCELYGLCEPEQKTLQLPSNIPAKFSPFSTDNNNNNNNNNSTDTDAIKKEKYNKSSQDIQNGTNSFENLESISNTINPSMIFTPRGSNYIAKLNTTGNNNSYSSTSTLSSSLFFIRGNKVICTGSLGTILECDITPEVLIKFGVVHGERLVGVHNKSFENKEGTILGVHMGCLVILLDGDKKATTLRGINGKDDLFNLFSKIVQTPIKVEETERNSIIVELENLNSLKHMGRDKDNKDDNKIEILQTKVNNLELIKTEDEQITMDEVKKDMKEQQEKNSTTEFIINDAHQTENININKPLKSDKIISLPPLFAEEFEAPFKFEVKLLNYEEESLVLPSMGCDDGHEKENKESEELLNEVETVVFIEKEEEEVNVNEINKETLKSEESESFQSYFFTSFLKAVSYWKMNILSSEEQRCQPLIFVKYYETNTQQKMMEAFNYFQKYKHFFPSSTQTSLYVANSTNDEGQKSIVSVYDIVQILVENEGIKF